MYRTVSISRILYLANIEEKNYDIIAVLCAVYYLYVKNKLQSTSFRRTGLAGTTATTRTRVT